jgi:hypothetical protein
MTTDILDFMRMIGTFSFAAIVGVVVFMMMGSFIDRKPKRDADSEDDEQGDGGKRKA